MDGASLRVSVITGRHSDAIQSCSLSCQLTNLIEEQIPDQSAFLKSRLKSITNTVCGFANRRRVAKRDTSFRC